MPRYFFHVDDGISGRDRDGTELPDLATAQREAVQLAAGLLANGNHDFWSGIPWRLEVAHADGLILFTLDFYGTMAPVLSGSRSDVS